MAVVLEEGEMVLKAFVNLDKCSACKKCPPIEACPVKAVFKVDIDGQAVIEQNSCFGCGDCVGKCSVEAIAIKEA